MKVEEKVVSACSLPVLVLGCRTGIYPAQNSSKIHQLSGLQTVKLFLIWNTDNNLTVPNLEQVKLLLLWPLTVYFFEPQQFDKGCSWQFWLENTYDKGCSLLDRLVGKDSRGPIQQHLSTHTKQRNRTTSRIGEVVECSMM